MNLEISSNAAAVLAKVEAFPQDMARAIADAMDDQNQITVGLIQTERLSGQGPFPPAEGRLGEKTGRLRPSAHRTDAVISNDDAAGFRVTSSIGSNVRYAKTHEFGADYSRTSRPGSVRLRTNAAGELLRQPGRRGAIFAGTGHKRIRAVAYAGGKTFPVHVPERAPFRRGLFSRVASYTRALSNGIVAAWNQRQTGGGA